jgi:hypothetical protein
MIATLTARAFDDAIEPVAQTATAPDATTITAAIFQLRSLSLLIW